MMPAEPASLQLNVGEIFLTFFSLLKLLEFFQQTFFFSSMDENL